MRAHKRGAIVTVIVVLAAMLLVATAAAAGCGEEATATQGPLELTEADQGKNFTVRAGETLEVILAGNPTTGYAWFAALDDDSAALLKQEGEPVYTQENTDADIVGAGGTYTFTFTAAGEGEALLKLIYVRAWEDVEPEETFEVNVTVE